MTGSVNNSAVRDIKLYIDGMSIHARVYRDSKTERFISVDSGRIFSKKKMNDCLKDLDRLRASIESKVKRGDIFRLIVSDYFPDMAIGEMARSAEWIYDACMEVIPYKKRNVDDQVVIDQKESIVDAMISAYRISIGVESGEIEQIFPVQWYRDSAFLYGHSKTIDNNDHNERTAIHNGMFLLLKAREDGKPMPSRLAIWLAMNPRDLFTTEEGRAERDRQAARLEQGETTL